MRSKFVPFAIMIALGAGSAAMAAETTTTGTIKSVDMKAHSVTLSDGMVYMLPKGTHEKSLKIGEKVAVVWDLKGNAHEASKITKIK